MWRLTKISDHITQLFSNVSTTVSSNVEIFHHVGGFWAFLEEDWDTDEAMVENLGQTDEAEAHTKSKKSTWAGNVGNSAHFFRFPESLRVWLLDENIDDCQVTLCIVVYFSFNSQCQSLVRNPFSPPSSNAQLDTNYQWKKSLGTLGYPTK